MTALLTGTIAAAARAPSGIRGPAAGRRRGSGLGGCAASFLAVGVAGLCSCSAASKPEAVAQSTGAQAGTIEASAPVAVAPPAPEHLRDFRAVTSRCTEAGLDAAAREAAKVPSAGRYRFVDFRTVDESHHALYEVDFKSSYVGEPILRYCVSVYCQQGWDSKAENASVRLMGNKSRPGEGSVPAAGCGDEAHGVRGGPKE
jgi:hypothetical protein